MASEGKYFVLFCFSVNYWSLISIFTEPDKFFFFNALFQGKSLLDGAWGIYIQHPTPHTPTPLLSLSLTHTHIHTKQVNTQINMHTSFSYVLFISLLQCFFSVNTKFPCVCVQSQVVMNTNGYSLAVDIWSLGCTILEMATSKPPWSQYEGVRLWIFGPYFIVVIFVKVRCEMFVDQTILSCWMWQVAAIFKIGNSRDVPEIPDHLSNDAKSFVRLCLQRDPSARPTALQLLDHSFVRDQATTRIANIAITKDAFPSTFDGSRTPVWP